MKRALSVLLDTLYTLALAFWLGGSAVIATVVMPALLPQSGLPTAPEASILGETLRRFLPLVELCGVVMVGIQFLLRRRYQHSRPLFVGDGVRQLLAFGALLLAEMGLRSLLPQMDAAARAGRAADFDHLRLVCRDLTTAQAGLLIAVVALTAWLQRPRPTAAPVAAPTPAETPPGRAPAAQKAVK